MAKTVTIGPYSAYAIAVAAGYQGTEQEWLASLVGPQGAQGSSVTGAVIDENGHLILTVHDPKTGTDTQLDAGSIDTTNAVQAVLAQIQQAGQDAVNSVAQSVQQAENSASAAAQSATEAQKAASSAKQDADNAAASAAVVSENAQNLQNVTDNLAAIQGAAGNAQAAAQSAQEAQQAAQQALGFRTFFDAISPDANGSLDPSRPMTTAVAQASWTVKSKGDRIQSVRINGFTQQESTGGLLLAAYTVTGEETFGTTVTNQSGKYRMLISGLPVAASIPENDNAVGIVYTTEYAGTSATKTYQLTEGVAITQQGYFSIYDERFNTNSTKDFKQHLKDLYAAGTPLKLWYLPADKSQATGLYTPVEIQGHEYRCQCLPLAEALGVEDNVQSHVPSGCDIKYVVTGNEEWSVQDYGETKRFLLKLPKDQYPLPMTAKKQYSNRLVMNTDLTANPSLATYGFMVYWSDYIGTTAVFLTASLATGVPELKTILQSWYNAGNPLVIYWRTTDYIETGDIPVSLETHANGNVYAHAPVDIEAIPYTADDSDKTPSTYDVSSLYGTTVQVSLKAMQDGGDAATLAGHTWADIQKLISDAVASAVALSK